MRRALPFVALLLSTPPLGARAQVDVNIHLGLPVSPPLVVVQPGVQVVEDHEEEVFYTRGWYWCRRGDHWYRARHPHTEFVYVERRHVPVAIVRTPPGHYRHWRKHERREERREWKRHEREERRHGHGHDHGGPGWREGRAEHREQPPPPAWRGEHRAQPAPPPPWQGDRRAQPAQQPPWRADEHKGSDKPGWKN